MKRTVLSLTFVLDTADTRHTLSATSAADLAAQVQEITGSRQVAVLARAAWDDHAADLKISGVRLVATGATVREVWRTLSPVKLASKAITADPANPEGVEEPAPAQEAQSDTPTAAPNIADPEVAQTSQQLTEHTQSDPASPAGAESTGEAQVDTPNKGFAKQTEPMGRTHSEALSDVADAVDSALSQFGGAPEGEED